MGKIMLDAHHSPATAKGFYQPVAENIWKSKYRYKTDAGVHDQTIDDTWQRVAKCLSAPELPETQDAFRNELYAALQGFRLLPAGRILAGAGTPRNVTLSNTFVMRSIPDSVDGIMDTIKDAALTMQMGGGLGFDFSTIRPQGTQVKGLDCPAAGPLAVMGYLRCGLQNAGHRHGTRRNDGDAAL